MKISYIEREFLHIFGTTWGNSIKFSGNMCLKITLKVTKHQGFTLSLEDKFFEKPQGESNWPPPPAVLGLRQGVKERIKFFDVRVISIFIIYFSKSLWYKSSYTISWIYYNLYHIYNTSPFFIMHNVLDYQKTNVEVLRHTVHENTSV